MLEKSIKTFLRNYENSKIPSFMNKRRIKKHLAKLDFFGSTKVIFKTLTLKKPLGFNNTNLKNITMKIQENVSLMHYSGKLFKCLN